MKITSTTRLGNSELSMVRIAGVYCTLRNRCSTVTRSIRENSQGTIGPSSSDQMLCARLTLPVAGTAPAPIPCSIRL